MNVKQEGSEPVWTIIKKTKQSGVTDSWVFSVILSCASISSGLYFFNFVIGLLRCTLGTSSAFIYYCSSVMSRIQIIVFYEIPFIYTSVTN